MRERLYEVWLDLFLKINLRKETPISRKTIRKKFKELMAYYEEPQRYYHNTDHIMDLINRALSGWHHVSIENILAIFYHDVIYDPKNLDNNEKHSVEFFMKHVGKMLEDVLNVSKIAKQIISTSNLYSPSEFENASLNDSPLYLSHLDQAILRSDSLLELLDYEQKIFKEFQFVTYSTYKQKRGQFLDFAFSKVKNPKLMEVKNIITNRKPKIGFYPGSFSPFHKGHQHILSKSEKMFDKVILGIGNNFSKKVAFEFQNECLPKYNEIVYYDGLITNCIAELEKEYNVTLIRGIRNEDDAKYELNFLNNIKRIANREFKSVLIPSDLEFQHISSSLVREIAHFNGDWKSLVNFNK